MTTKTLPPVVDVVIVGSGPVGSAFARLIKEQLPTADVVMVERGPVLAEPRGMNTRNLGTDERAAAQSRAEGLGGQRVDAFAERNGEPLIRPRPGTQLVTITPAGGDAQRGMPGALVASSVGGMGSFWTCAVPRPLGSERIPFLPPERLDDALETAERLLEANLNGFPTTASGELVLDRLAAEFDTPGFDETRVRPMPLACRRAPGETHPRWTGADVVLGPLATMADGEDGFWLLAECAATRILMDGDTAVGIEARIAGAEDAFEIAAKIVVIAADALRTPQLLWASGIRPAALGRYLNDQAQVVAAAFLGEAVSTPPLTVDDPSGVEDALDSEMNHPFHGTADGGQESVTGVTWVPFDRERNRPFHGQVMQLDASPIAIGDAAVFDPRPVVGIGYFAPKDLRASDRVHFDPADPDEFGLPGIRIDYELTPADHETLAQAVALAERTVAALGECSPGGEPTILPAGSSIHYQGTVRMGASDDATSVCNTSSEVWGTRNLFVGGNGVIPTATGCNPTLTGVALAALAVTRIVGLLR